MDKNDKKILVYFLNKGRSQAVEAHTLQKELNIKLEIFDDILGSCLDHDYLWHSPSATGAKFAQYGLTETGLRVIDNEIKDGSKIKLQKIRIVITVCGVISVIIIAGVSYFKIGS